MPPVFRVGVINDHRRLIDSDLPIDCPNSYRLLQSATVEGFGLRVQGLQSKCCMHSIYKIYKASCVLEREHHE